MAGLSQEMTLGFSFSSFSLFNGRLNIIQCLNDMRPIKEIKKIKRKIVSDCLVPHI